MSEKFTPRQTIRDFVAPEEDPHTAYYYNLNDDMLYPYWEYGEELLPYLDEEEELMTEPDNDYFSFSPEIVHLMTIRETRTTNEVFVC